MIILNLNSSILLNSTGPTLDNIDPAQLNQYFLSNGPALLGEYCICIRTRGGMYGKIWPEPKGNPEGSGLILPYIPT